MRNIYDQYDQPENRLTHALASTLAHDRKLIRPFLRWVGIRTIPPLRSLRIVEQQVPGDEIPADEAESPGLPDMCIFDDESWCVLFEAKVQAPVRSGQLRRHVSTAARHGYESARLVVLAVDPPKGRLPKNVRQVEWRDLFAWFSRRADRSAWARRFVEYMQVFESRMIARDYEIRGTITMFDGFHFDHDNPYTYREGKRLIRLLGDELQRRSDLRKIGVDPKGDRRSAITGRGGDVVWDFLPLKVARDAAQFTDYPHLTLDIGREGAGAAITVPNGVKGGFRSKLRDLEADGFTRFCQQLLRRLRPVLRQSRGSKPVVYALQRHFASQRSAGIADARLNADLRTIVPGGSDGVKYQPEWIEAIYALLTRKRSNIQFGTTVRFSYNCPRIRSRKAVDLYARTWIALSPLLDFVLE